MFMGCLGFSIQRQRHYKKVSESSTLGEYLDCCFSGFSSVSSCNAININDVSFLELVSFDILSVEHVHQVNLAGVICVDNNPSTGMEEITGDILDVLSELDLERAWREDKKRCR